MKVIGVTQLNQIKYKFLDIPRSWRGIMGDMTERFIGIVYGDSGEGKTEFCMQLAKMLTEFGKVAWMSYEQGHGADLQKAVARNKMPNGRFLPVDPIEKVGEGLTLFDDLCTYLSKRGTPEFIVIDSIDYTGFTKEQYKALKEKYRKKKAFIFISHAAGKKPKSGVATYIEYDGQFGIYVKDYIAQPFKNRMGGRDPYVIWAEEARRRNPLAFVEIDSKRSTY